MKLRLPAFAAGLVALLAAPAALACPGMAASGCGVCTSFGSYVSSVSLGVLIGVASVGVETVLKRRR